MEAYKTWKQFDEARTKIVSAMDANAFEGPTAIGKRVGMAPETVLNVLRREASEPVPYVLGVSEGAGEKPYYFRPSRYGKLL